MITLLTDFGTRDIYVGVMKGAIAQINPALQVVDLTHEIPPQDLFAARFNLMSAFPYFPLGTIHVAVVDPGVGGARRAIALQLQTAFLVGPDNGIFSGILEQHPAIAAVELTNPSYWRTSSPSSTFHGRDIFAPVGAHLASGVPLSALGRAIAPDSLVSLPLYPCEPTAAGTMGTVQYIDQFGNLITNIPASLVSDSCQGDKVTHSWCIQLATTTIPAATTYAAVPQGAPLALIGSHGWVEIAINGGNAQQKLGLCVGDRLKLHLSPLK
ncbi:MAG TPA: SAM-dependent chlorinase/fluorinase [Synechococcales cyanobacterium M55_K2018_004]|nr:SAM-dependent chlorinase/fluorinase [Synechococcales cyanobacterium M55_K2018_004]